jgi:hypothetical protein
VRAGIHSGVTRVPPRPLPETAKTAAAGGRAASSPDGSRPVRYCGQTRTWGTVPDVSHDCTSVFPLQDAVAHLPGASAGP